MVDGISDLIFDDFFADLNNDIMLSNDLNIGFNTTDTFYGGNNSTICDNELFNLFPEISNNLLIHDEQNLNEQNYIGDISNNNEHSYALVEEARGGLCFFCKYPFLLFLYF